MGPARAALDNLIRREVSHFSTGMYEIFEAIGIVGIFTDFYLKQRDFTGGGGSRLNFG